MADNKPVFGIIYGKSGRGKTFGITRAFAADGVFISPKRSIEAQTWFGVDLGKRLIEDNDFGTSDATDFIKKHGKKVRRIIFDDYSLGVDAEVRRIRKSVSGWKVWERLVDKHYELRDAALDADCDVWLVMHEQNPRTIQKDGHDKVIQGAPLVPGFVLPEKLPAMAQLVARVVWDKGVGGGWPWVYQTGPDPEYQTKNRCGVATPHRFPPNLAEILRRGGRDVPYPKELPWMNKAVDMVADTLLQEWSKGDEADTEGVLRAANKTFSDKGFDPRHILWAMSDGWARAKLVHAEQNVVDAWITGVVSNDEAEEI
jgi:hypothetical protein